MVNVEVQQSAPIMKCIPDIICFFISNVKSCIWHTLVNMAELNNVWGNIDPHRCKEYQLTDLWNKQQHNLFFYYELYKKYVLFSIRSHVFLCYFCTSSILGLSINMVYLAGMHWTLPQLMSAVKWDTMRHSRKAHRQPLIPAAAVEYI